MPQHDGAIGEPLVKLLPVDIAVPQLVVAPADKRDILLPLRISIVLLHLLREQYQMSPTAITGPATDNSSGTDVISTRMQVAAWNARTQLGPLTDCVLEACGLQIAEEDSLVAPA